MLIRTLPPHGERKRSAELQENVDCLSKKVGRAVVGVQDKRFTCFHLLD